MKRADLGARAPNPRPRSRRRQMRLANDGPVLVSTTTAVSHTPVATICSPGHCRVCGCTELEPCDLGAGFHCWWVDAPHTLCSSPRCLAVVPIAELEQEAGITTAGA
jgi:hypothetical protein